MNAREFTEKDNEYKAKLVALQAEQKELVARIKADRKRKAEITAEFYAIKAEWLKVCGPTHTA